MACDVAKGEQIDANEAKTAEAFGPISTLVDNAGCGRAYPDPLAVSAEEMIERYKLNTLSAMRMTAACPPYLDVEGGG